MSKFLRSPLRVVALPTLVAGVLLLGGCSGDSANEYEVPLAEGAGLSTAKKEFSSLSTNRAELKPVDLTGENRPVQMTDRWKICTQNVEPGAEVNFNSVIELGVVQEHEDCPATGYVKDVKPREKSSEAVSPANPVEGWTPEEPLIGSSVAAVVEQAKKEQKGDLSNLKAIHVETAKEVPLSPKYKVCFTSPSGVTRIDPSSSVVVALFVVEEEKECMSEAQFNEAG